MKSLVKSPVLIKASLKRPCDSRRPIIQLSLFMDTTGGALQGPLDCLRGEYIACMLLVRESRTFDLRCAICDGRGALTARRSGSRGRARDGNRNADARSK